MHSSPSKAKTEVTIKGAIHKDAIKIVLLEDGQEKAVTYIGKEGWLLNHIHWSVLLIKKHDVDVVPEFLVHEGDCEKLKCTDPPAITPKQNKLDSKVTIKDAVSGVRKHISRLTKNINGHSPLNVIPL